MTVCIVLDILSQSTTVTVLCFPCHCHEGIGGSGCTAPLIPNLDTRLRWVVTFILWPLCCWRTSPQYALNMMLGGPQTCSHYFGKDEYLYSLPGIELWLLSCWAGGLVYIICSILAKYIHVVVVVVVIIIISAAVVVIVIIIYIIISIKTPSLGSSWHCCHYPFDRRLRGFQICSGGGMEKRVIYCPCLESHANPQLSIPQSSCYT